VLDAVVAGASDEALRKIVTAHITAIAKQSGGPELSEAALKAQVDNAMLQGGDARDARLHQVEPRADVEKLQCPVLALGARSICRSPVKRT
jgi:hypothetical protein